MSMKKLIAGFIFILLFLFVSMWIIVGIDKNNINDIKDKISKNTNIEDISYVNKYDNYYIVKNSDYVYVLDIEYKEIDKISIDKLYDNDKDYDLIYIDNELLYMNDYNDKEGLVFKYYDVYTYELVDEVMVGGSYG